MPRKRNEPKQKFNRNIPPAFRRGGELWDAGTGKDLGARVAFLAEMDQEQVTMREWQRCYDIGCRALAEICFWARRTPTDAEWTALEWLRDAGHAVFLTGDYFERNHATIFKMEELQKQVRSLSNQLTHHKGCKKCKCNCEI